MKSKKEIPDCCKPKPKGNGFWSGFLYGLIPHTGCIAFILFSILGVTTATAFFKPLLMSPNFFYFLILLSFVFATISAAIYLRKHNLFHLKGVALKKGYLSILYGTTIGVNILLFLVIFPLVANYANAIPTDATGASLELSVDIPCPGHAPLISGELMAVQGVLSAQFKFPNDFDVIYNPSITSKNEILSIEVFDAYPATVLSESTSKTIQTQQQPTAPGCSRCGGCSGACGGTCGG